MMWLAILLACTSDKHSPIEPTAEDHQDSSAPTDTQDTGTSIEELDCDALAWTYDNTGAPFMNTWCTSCHSSQLDADERSGAPIEVNLDTHSAIQTWIPYILHRIYNETTPMPPVGDPPEDELQQVADWLRCDAP